MWVLRGEAGVLGKQYGCPRLPSLSQLWDQGLVLGT